ncbi:MAG: hypothetical protein EZS28_044653 [Streblomastix strix]|uniref:Uncharacterized protein n=1 Tax=Streblomastix strix TaxID=222440 RepID=A0A5J4TPJ8_9EUKA|nr:MAG: hypothetical protein EZS28_044653 [Streblomastix strix]
MAPRTSKANFCVRVSLILSVIVVCLLYVVIAIAGIALATRKGNVTQVKLVAAVVIIVGIVGTITSLVGIYGIWKNKLEGVPKFALLFFAGSVVILHVLLMVMGFVSLCFKPIIKTISLLDEKPHTIYQTAIKYFNVVGVFCFIAAAVTIVILILVYFSQLHPVLQSC